MNRIDREITLYTDLLIAETLFMDSSLSKTAQSGGMVSGLIDRVKHYFMNNVDESDPVHSVLNFLAPGAIATTFSALGLGWFGWMIGLAIRFFHIDVMAILSGIWGELRSSLSEGRKLSSSEVDSIVHRSVQEHAQPATQEEASHASQLAEHEADDGMPSVAAQLRAAQMMRLAMEEYKNYVLHSEAAPPPGWFSTYSQKKAQHSNLLGRVLSLFFRVALASAGLMVAGDVVSKLMGRPSALDDTVQHGKPVGSPSGGGLFGPSTPSTPPWAVSVPNTPGGIEEMLMQFAKETYPDQVTGHEDEIQNLPAFKHVADTIAWYNHSSSGGPVVFIPKVFSSKKEVVDYFMHTFSPANKAA